MYWYMMCHTISHGISMRLASICLLFRHRQAMNQSVYGLKATAFLTLHAGHALHKLAYCLFHALSIR